MNLYTQVLTRDNHSCQDCGSHSQLEVHHLLPLSQGGKNELSNLKTLCQECHDLYYNDVHYPEDKSKIIPFEEREERLIALDQTKQTKVLLVLPGKLFEKVDDHRFNNRISSRSEAIRTLIEKALDSK